MSQIRSEQISLDEFVRLPYLRVLTYPSTDLRLAKARMAQLEKIGVEGVIFEGRTKVGRLGLVGLGTVSIVVKALLAGGEVCTLKIRRVDANRPSMADELGYTQLANRADVGARVLASTEDLLALEYVRGEEVEDYLKSIKGRGTSERTRRTVHSILNQCRKLDLIRLDHGQLSDLRKHVLMDGERPYILDFESASRERKPKNVTTAAQYLLIGGRCSVMVRRRLSVRDTAPILGALRSYRRDESDENYVRILSTLRIPM